jgi:6-phosphogluconolactonase
MSLLAVGTYTRKEGHVDGKARGIELYRLSEDSTFALLSTTPALNPSFVAFSQCGRFLYAVAETGEADGPSSTVTAYRVEGNELTRLNDARTHGFAACHVIADRANRRLFVANYCGRIAALEIAEDGSLAEEKGDAKTTQVIQFDNIASTHARQDCSHPHAILLSPDERFVFVTDLGTDRIMIYAVQPGKRMNGAGFEPLRPRPDAAPFLSLSTPSGPRHLAFHPTGRFLYCINELSSTITVMKYASESGDLEVIESVSTLSNAESLVPNWCSDIHIGPGGKFLYGSNRGHDSLAIFSIDPESGRLRLVAHESTRGTCPRNFLIDAASERLLVANQNSDSIVVYKIESDGRLTYLTAADVLTPVCLQLSFLR